jgi:hypothetical protein
MAKRLPHAGPLRGIPFVTKAALVSIAATTSLIKDKQLMKRIFAIGLTACAFAFAPILSASAMTAAHPATLGARDAAIVQVHGHAYGHGWGHHRGHGHHYGWSHHHH